MWPQVSFSQSAYATRLGLCEPGTSGHSCRSVFCLNFGDSYFSIENILRETGSSKELVIKPITVDKLTFVVTTVNGIMAPHLCPGSNVKQHMGTTLFSTIQLILVQIKMKIVYLLSKCKFNICTSSFKL